MPSLSQRIREVAAAVSSVLCLTSEHAITDTSSTSDRTVVAASHDEKISTSTSNSTITSTIIPAHDLSRFENDYPQYALTLPLDLLRRREYMRLSSNSETYVDYMGGSLYPESLVGDHARLLQTRTFGNTHSINST
jgi:molybdenum cofactor sulfurtransferase